MTLISTNSSTKTALTVEHLNVSTAGRTLIDDVGFTIGAGERVGLIGESGSGKSVTSLAVMGLLPDSLTASGTITVGDDPRNVVGLSERESARMRGLKMSMVFQEPMTALNPLMKVGDQIAEAALIHKTTPTWVAARKRAVQLIADVGLPDPAEAAGAYPHQLSGGQRQRVVLAIALANDPTLLVADEPTTALDVTVQRQVLDLVQRTVAERDTGLLFITHDLAVVGNVCDRILVMHHGVVVEEGLTENVLTRPQHPYTRGLLAASDLDATDEQGRLFTVSTAEGYVPGRFVDRLGEATARVAERGAGEQQSMAGASARPESDSVPPSGAPVVKVTDLTREYGSRRSGLFGKGRRVKALQGVSYEITSGRRFGIVGESGSGKSTMLRILSGLDRPTSGNVEVVGRDLTNPGKADLAELRRNLQVVFQDPMASLDPRMKVKDIIAEPLLNAGNLESGQAMDAQQRRNRVDELLEQVGLPADAADRYPHEFSGGQRQRISIARALSCRPRILVADEPVSALDVSVRAQVLNLLADLVDEYGLTLIFVSHDLGVVRYLCDEVAVMKNGRIVELGPTSKIYDDPQNEYTKALIRATPTIQHLQEA
ncbi:MAG: dipeptide ABC transporter ATP-binding protein [Galactobacter sp.]|uniref:dipeptide ABC transporter ATP-binding protein n=1 Tax=Galactobacter sp. TaxID=2676125 RepID=UPI0025C4A31F|nr:ABC transporter ATP-binding protein [Galactobacter sp.]